MIEFSFTFIFHKTNQTDEFYVAKPNNDPKIDLVKSTPDSSDIDDNCNIDDEDYTPETCLSHH